MTGYGVDGLAIASRLAAQGFKVFPVKAGGKAPANRNGFKTASSDPGDWHDETGQWWTGNHAGDNVGIATGLYRDGRCLVVIDLDRHDGGADGVEGWLAKAADHEDFITLMVETPNQGGHIYFWCSRELSSGAGPVPGIDIKANGGYVLGPCSALATGEYGVVLDAPISPMPGWVMDWIESSREGPTETKAPRPAATPRQMSTPRTGNTSTDEWAARTDWADLLVPDGWTLHRIDGSGERHWTRPGKDPRDGTSATTGFTAKDTMKVFSTSHGTLTTIGTHSKLGYLTATKFGGDYKAAAASLRPVMTDKFVTTFTDRTGLSTRVDPATGEILEETRNLSAETWESRPWLRQVRDAAWNRMMPPDAVLGAVLARVATIVPPCYLIPAIIGTQSTFDHLSVLVGDSASGKSAATGIARELVPETLEHVIVWDVPVGSGEGLIDQFYEWVSEEDDGGKPRKVKRHTKTAVHFVADEAKMIAEQAKRSGTTIISVICSAWSGASLGTANAGSETNRPKINGRTVRLAGVMSIQSKLGHQLLTDDLVQQGFAGRLAFFAAEDPTMPHPDNRPQWPGSLSVIPLPGGLLWPQDIAYPPEVVDYILLAQWDKSRGESKEDSIEGHIRLARLKIAGLIAAIEGETTVTLDDWALAGEIIECSNAIRRHMEHLGAQAALEAATRQGRQQGRRQAAADEVLEVDELRKIAALSDAIADRVPADGIGRGVLSTKMCSGLTRHRFEPALQRAIDAGLVVIEEGRVKRVV